MKNLSRKAQFLILGTILVGAPLSIFNLLKLGRLDSWVIILAVLTAVTQVKKVEGATIESSYNLSWVLYGFTYLLFGAPATVFIILSSHLVEWIWYKYPWYIQLYNVSTYAIAMTVAHLVITTINPDQAQLTLVGTLSLLAGLVVFTLMNHLLIALVLWVARGLSFQQSGVFGYITLMIDSTMMALGITAAFIWEINPFAAIFVLAPIILVQNGLKLPSLKRQAEVDPKTGLFNAKFFSESLSKELERAIRFNRPLTVVLGDLDLLRNINNTYGHLAGDVVLFGIAEMLQKTFRDSDLVSRFGGEEFAILMAGTSPDEAVEIVEIVRETIATQDFEVDTSIQSIKATMSFGISGYYGAPGEFDPSPEDLINNADSALYNAKLNGRNKTVLYSNRYIEELFKISYQAKVNEQNLPIGTEFKQTQSDGKTLPLQEPPKAKETLSGKHQPKLLPVSQPLQVNVFIGVITLVAVALAGYGISNYHGSDFYGILIFSLVILMTEVFSINIYTKDSSVSTAAAPLIAGTLLFGVTGALVLSLVISLTATIKKRSSLIRLIFNTSNHFLSSSLSTLVFLVSQNSFTSFPVYIQLFISLGAGVVVYFSSTLMLSGVLHLTKGQNFKTLWMEHFSWLLPYYAAFGLVSFALILGYTSAGFIGVTATMVPLLIIRLSQYQYIENTKSLVSQLHSTNTILEGNNQTISMINEDLLMSLANTIDLRDSYTMGHSKHVANIVTTIAKGLGLPAEKVEMIRKSALLHDIGKIGIPDSILFKPGDLTYEEFEIIKQHPVRGAEILEVNTTLRELGPIIRHHHEHYDGSGYPDGLQGVEIPYEARILTLADSVQAMLSNRPYRNGLEIQEIISEVRENVSSQFDPEIARVFLYIMENDPAAFNLPFSLVQSGSSFKRKESA